MKLALIFFCVLAGVSWFVPQKPVLVCRGKVLPIQLLPGPKMTGPPLPLRFGGTRDFPRPPINSFLSAKPFRRVIKTRAEFSAFWKEFTAPIPPTNGVLPPPPEVDFSKEMVVVSAMGERPTSGYWTVIDGACEVDGQVEVFVTSLEETCGASFGVVTYPADAVRLPRTDLPVVFRESQLSCTQWRALFGNRK
jgi:hypothetical protein